MDSVLRPRDIQARIRSGESPEAVAEAAQTTVDKIMAFAAPVLAERAYIATQAQKASVRRRAGDGPIGHLGEAVAARLSADDVDPEDVEWDSWRREDGRWVLVADYAAGRQARFVFDVAGRYVTAEDDEARRLVGERTPGSTAPGAQLPLGDDAIEVVTGRRPEPVQRPDPVGDPTGEPTVDLGDAVRAVRGLRGAGPGQDDWIRTQASDRPPAAAEPAPVVEEALFDAADVHPEAEPAADPAADPGAAEVAADSLVEPAAPEAPAAEAAVEPAADSADGAGRPRKPKKATRSKGRASVPSWDEIMFGSGRSD